MPSKISPIPEGHSALTARLTVPDAKKAIAFYKKAFGATELGEPLLMPNGSVAHAEVKIGDSRLMLTDETKGGPTRSPLSLGGTTGCLNLYVKDVDAVFAKALEAGAKVVFPLADQFYGDRSGRVSDPFGHHWILASRIEEVSLGEMKKRMANLKP